MLKVVKRCFLSAVATSLLLAQNSMAADGITGNLVTATWLEQNRNNADVLILDASPRQIYAAKHIPGALSVDIMTYGFPEPTLAEMERRYQTWGVSPGKKIVMYDQGGTYLATRLFFSLHHHGFPAKDLFVLDGGLAKWEQLGLPVTKEAAPAPAKGSFRITKVNDELRVRLPEFVAASGDLENNVLVDALGPDWHFGEISPFDRPGHIPNSILLSSAEFFNADKTFKSADEIRRMVDYLGIRPEQRIHSYCGGGIAASVPFFALKYILNYPKVSLFTESQMGWLSDPRGLPVWTYDAPSLVRETSWLRGWGAGMLRMYGISQVSIVDVRPAAAYGEGHVPFAVNVPAEVFRSHVGDPGKLAGILGPAGVNPSHEAVVVSGAGLTPDAALAFLLLEKVGQQKVSVFADSMEEWSALGLKLAKEATVVGPPKGPQVPSVPPATYAPAIRKELIITDPKSTKGVYPKVFVASGKTAPANAPEGTVVHVPYSDLVNADGMPKAAKEIWNVLTKAGVPRYAELVCFSDDPGEAALNYFILKLMGYPDVKVWVR